MIIGIPHFQKKRHACLEPAAGDGPVRRVAQVFEEESEDFGEEYADGDAGDGGHGAEDHVGLAVYGRDVDGGGVAAGAEGAGPRRQELVNNVGRSGGKSGMMG